MVYYITGALICSTLYFVCCTAVTGSNADRGYKDESNYGKNLDIVYPRRVTEDGEFISYFLPNTYKRSHQKKHLKHSSGNTIHYIVPYRGIDHHLDLRPNCQFISPGMVTENHRKAVVERRINHVNDTQCHYTGFVRGDKYSKVAISTCNGLTGYVRTKRHYFFIEPASKHNPSNEREQPHVISLHTLEDNFVANCESTGNIAEIIAKRATRYQREENLNKCIAELHIETLVVVDHSMLTYHKEIDLENYVLTVFNMAHDLYHDASLGTNINLAIVRLIRLEEEDHEMNIAINKDATKTLDYFREWQNTINPKEDTHPNHHDVAVLLTRIDICGTDNSCGLLGASKIGGMCDPHNQAAVCEDNGLRLGFVIAHEIAHTLAILHDTVEDSGCNSTLTGNLTTVMDPSVSIHTAGWSPCSNRFLQLFVDSGFGKCMYDTPTEHTFVALDILPGVMYDGNFQCRELFGPNAALCMTGIECENLICYIEDKGCVETHTGVAPGTSCGEKMWCYRGECVEIGERPGAVDGGWSAWSEWSECSRTCGSGVAVRERHCDNPQPKYGGKYCAGEHMRHRICATEPCDVSQPSFRDVQCSEFNSWVYPEDEKIHTWKNYPMHDENPCVLFCINDFGDIASLRPRVIDGTSCQRGIRDICINGLCQEIPCDLDLESNAIEDACGVCRGDSTSCDLIMGEISVPCCGHIKEEKLMVVPKNSINIKIEEMMPTESRIQIRNCEGETIFVIGNVLGTFDVPGSIAWMGNIRAKQEAVRIPGPITDSISIWLVVVENVTIRYSYGISTKKQRTPEFYWDFLRWKRCSAECGSGIEESYPSCVEKIGGEVDEQYCKNITKPDVRIRTCENAPCVTRWFVGDWQACSKCPKGKRYRVVKCVQPTGQGEGEVVFVSDSLCFRPKPKHKETCTCSVTNSPSRKRDVSVDSTGYVVAKAPKEAKQQTKEELQVDINGNVLNAKENVLNKQPPTIEETTQLLEENDNSSIRDDKNLTSTTAMSLLSTQMGKMNISQNSEECKNVSLENQYKAINVNLSAPHCPTDVEYDDELYCNKTQGDYEIETDTTVPHINLTTCIVLTVMEVTNATENITETEEEITTEPMNTYENVTLAVDLEQTVPDSILRKNKSEEMCAKLAKLIGQTILDQDNYKNLSLTVHTELENGRIPAGLPPALNGQEVEKSNFGLRGKEAMKFMDIMQKNFENNKTKIRRSSHNLD